MTKSKETAREYFQKYIDLSENTDIESELESSLDEVVEVIKELSNAESEVPYEKGKWTIKEVLVHMIDTERVFQYRALRFGRGDKIQPLQFDHDAYAEESRANNRSLVDIIFEYMTVRNASISLFKGMDNTALSQRGSWSDSEFTVSEIGLIISGHSRHHIRVIKEKYLN